MRHLQWGVPALAAIALVGLVWPQGWWPRQPARVPAPGRPLYQGPRLPGDIQVRFGVHDPRSLPTWLADSSAEGARLVRRPGQRVAFSFLFRNSVRNPAFEDARVRIHPLDGLLCGPEGRDLFHTLATTGLDGQAACVPSFPPSGYTHRLFIGGEVESPPARAPRPVRISLVVRPDAPAGTVLHFTGYVRIHGRESEVGTATVEMTGAE